MDRTYRQATFADLGRIAEILYDDPPMDAVGACGSAEKARRLGPMLVNMGISPRLRSTEVALHNDRVIALMDADDAAVGDGVGPATIARVLLKAIPVLKASGVITFVRWQLARARVTTDPPAGSYYIAELDVDAEYRNQGLGGALLERAEQAARSRGFRAMSLNTAVTNPARRLYERNGYIVTATKCDPAYERLTTIPGRVLMVKDLGDKTF